jgi:hypothetical protein
MKSYKFLDLILEDDDTPTGGVAFQGETLEQFLECDFNNGTTSHETFDDYYSYLSIEDIDEKLKNGGIRPLRETLAKNLMYFYNNVGSEIDSSDYGEILYNLENDQRKELSYLRHIRDNVRDFIEMIEEIM